MAIRPFEQHSPQIDPTAWVDDSAVVIGQVRIGADSSVWPLTAVRGDINAITIGARSNIQDGSVLHVTHDSEYAPGGFALSIGDDVTIGHKVILHACTIGNRCLVGMGSTVLDGVVFEDEVMLGAHSLVSPGKVLESGYLYLGAPARKARALTDRERAFLRYSATHYVELKNRYCA
ncbi:MAG: gamma carbonic anhydrase family protein [Granulosicoccaceae bacterium]|jgi:carbonic anhydrase/acetyltransferase-like protein (isoleucine patch superfamily)